MSDVKRYWVATQALYEKEWVGVEGLVVSAGDHDAKVAELEAEIGHLKHRLEAADEWATIASEQLRGRDVLAAELAALKGAAGEAPEVALIWVDQMKLAVATNNKPIEDGAEFMTIAQHQRIVAAMARDAEGLVAVLEQWKSAEDYAKSYGHLPEAEVQSAWHEACAARDAALAAHSTRNGNAPL